jgi:hypothetical protein
MGLIDGPELLYTELCDPETWSHDMLQCIPADNNNLASYFIPDWVNRAINVVSEEGELTDWCMGAVGSAILFQ